MKLETAECRECGQPFERAPAGARRGAVPVLCSRDECRRARKAAWARNKRATDPEFRQKEKEASSKYQKRPEVRARQQASSNAKYHGDPEYRRRLKERQRRHYAKKKGLAPA